MKIQNFETIELEALAEFIKATSPEDLETSISKMTPAQIAMAVQWIDKEKIATGKKKIRAVIQGLKDRPQLEAAARALSLDQITYLIDNFFQPENQQHAKLSPILLGLSFEIFSQFLFFANDQQLKILEHEGVTEPVQHQLTLLCHEFTKQIDRNEEEIDEFCEDIDCLNPEDLIRDEVFELIYDIEVFADFFERFFVHINKALAIAWNTNRPDLIETLNRQKDSCQKYIVYGIGSPRNATENPTGLYAELEDILFEAYGDPEDTNDRGALRDDEPAIEGLAKFEVCYLHDYWELGLIPSVKNPKEIEIDLSKHSEMDRTQFRENLFKEAQENLKKINLTTVRDLKQFYIFSKKTLLDYIQEKSAPQPLKIER